MLVQRGPECGRRHLCRPALFGEPHCRLDHALGATQRQPVRRDQPLHERRAADEVAGGQLCRPGDVHVHRTQSAGHDGWRVARFLHQVDDQVLAPLCVAVVAHECCRPDAE